MKFAMWGSVATIGDYGRDRVNCIHIDMERLETNCQAISIGNLGCREKNTSDITQLGMSSGDHKRYWRRDNVMNNVAIWLARPNHSPEITLVGENFTSHQL